MKTTRLKSALAVAPDRAAVGVVNAERELFCFDVGDLRLGVASTSVREVVRCNALTPLPRAPSFLLGVTGHRGEVFPVLDLLRLFGKGEVKVGQRSRLVVGLSGRYVAALVVDGGVGLQKISEDAILPPPLGGEAGAEFVTGIVPGKGGDIALHLVDMARLLESCRARAVRR